jgi:hypothetical protein
MSGCAIRSSGEGGKEYLVEGRNLDCFRSYSIVTFGRYAADY